MDLDITVNFEVHIFTPSDCACNCNSVGNKGKDKGAIAGGAAVGAALVLAGWVIVPAWRWCRERQDHFTDVAGMLIN